MRIITSAEVEAALEFKDLIERLRETFRKGAEVPVRHHHAIGGGSDATLLLMPAWQPGRHIGIKLVTVFPHNGERSLPSVMGAYLLLNGTTGEPLAMIDGPTLTVKRTAAASALAAGYLARQDSERLLMIGTGALAPYLIRAHAEVRPICNVLIWGRNPDKAEQLARRLNRRDFKVAATTDLEAAVQGAHIVSAATMTLEPLIKGAWLQPGQHLDLVGGFRPDMREADDDAVLRARVFVDTRDGACSEAGDIVQPLESGVLTEDDIAADLFDLTRGERAGRRYYDQITLFKSVGTALEDLGAAQLAYERA
ncbi:MAG: ornithine cyclodeaminase family protein [Kiloniellales bacterium]|nr:ornithine cyclodeaminase family protein [Kiloniellales bacterium]MDJ0969051.1 ornithine cyclodeaminase family protein [Kiloniellales bacterium]MDJ0980121.1 ornithine cyclodeaminase family protein [Kiloniellales bacterium]